MSIDGSMEISKIGSFFQIKILLDGHGQFSKFKKYMKAMLLLTIAQNKRQATLRRGLKFPEISFCRNTVLSDTLYINRI